MAIKPNGQIVPPLMCQRCVLSGAGGCSWKCIRGDDTAEIYVLRQAIARIDAINDNPAVYNSEINAVCDTILRPELVLMSGPSSSQDKP